MDLFLVCLLVVFGVALMVLELFFLPGVGLAGVSALLSMVGAVVYAYLRMSPLAGHLTLAAVCLLLTAAIVVFIKSRTWDKMAMKTEIKDKVDLVSGLDIQPGDRGITSSRLAPMGKVMVNGHEQEARSQGTFIDPETPVEIVAIEGNTLVVKTL